MNGIYCFSGSGHSAAVAGEFSRLLGWDVTVITGEACPGEPETAVVVFPVYCQNIPGPVKAFLKSLRAKYVVLIATYGKISWGNVLWEAQRILRGTVIAGAYVPMGHTFLDGDHSFDGSFLEPVRERLESPREVTIPRWVKNPLSNIFPAWRSRVGVKIRRNDRCDHCGLCTRRCPVDAMEDGRPKGNCIRCLRCVVSCPQKALAYENTKVLAMYLNHYHKEKLVLYL